MARHFTLLAIAVIAAALTSLTIVLRAQNMSTKVPYRANGQEATLVGTFRFSGKTPRPLLIDTSADPACKTYLPELTAEWVVIRDGRLLNVLVYATGTLLDDHSFEPPSSPAVLAHINCRYRPHMLGMQVGQTLNIINVDNTENNTHPTPKFNPEWNRKQMPGSPPITKTFNRAEVAIPFKDNQHPWKKAYVAIFTHPFFAVSDSEGNYRIEGLPPGTYRITVWQETLGEKSIEVTLKAGESQELNFSYSRDDLKGSWLDRY